MAVRTSQFVVYRGLKDLLLYLKRLFAAVLERQRKAILVAAETGIPGFFYGLYRMGAVAVSAYHLLQHVHHPEVDPFFKCMAILAGIRDRENKTPPVLKLLLRVVAGGKAVASRTSHILMCRPQKRMIVHVERHLFPIFECKGHFFVLMTAQTCRALFSSQIGRATFG